MRIALAWVALLASTLNVASADLADELADLVGYTIVDSKTIVGWKDDGEADEDSFEGCDFDRQIQFDDGSTLTCGE